MTLNYHCSYIIHLSFIYTNNTIHNNPYSTHQIECNAICV
eukprot:UN03810